MDSQHLEKKFTWINPLSLITRRDLSVLWMKVQRRFASVLKYPQGKTVDQLLALNDLPTTNDLGEGDPMDEFCG
jgi:hypothetical protein